MSHIMCSLVRVLWCVAMISVLTGCQTVSKRMPAYLGASANSKASQVKAESFPSASSQVGLVMITDSTNPGAAPQLPPDMLAILENRLVEKVSKEFPFSLQPVLLEKGLNPVGDPSPFLGLAKENKFDFLLLAVFTSTELESNTEIGEARMMTRMTATEVQNDALAELALLEGSSGHLLLQATGVGEESMDLLAAPLDTGSPGEGKARGILRGNAAQKALDQAILELRREWNKIAGA